MKAKEQIHEEILETPIKELLADLGSALEVAVRNKEILSSTALANDINTINRIVDSFAEIECKAYEDEQI